jgi:predicted Rossmann fold flavoprotein
MEKEIQDFDVVIIGAGGAGMMCAIHAGRRGRKVLLLDHASEIGKKILISGGGRCNFTNIHTDPTSYVSQNPHFCKSALSRFTPEDFIKMVQLHHIPFHEKKLGQLFCDGSAKNIVNMLVKECEKSNADIRLRCKIKNISKNETFRIETDEDILSAQSVVIATGGLSIPQIGATGFGYDIARRFGLNIITPVPALDGFNFSKKDSQTFRPLAGVSIDSVVTCNNVPFRENILFTHAGLSGPASLQSSLYWNHSDAIKINLLPAFNSYDWLSEKRQANISAEIKNVLAERLPKRFAEIFCSLNAISGPLREISDAKLKQLCDTLHDWEIVPESTVGFRKAEVTRGGVDTDELSSKTMESRKVPGLYFIGEVVDVTGWLGGYNFQWAWASAFAASQYV